LEVQVNNMNDKELHKKFCDIYYTVNDFLKIYYENFKEKRDFDKKDDWHKKLYNDIISDIDKTKEEFFGMIADDLNNR
jgi:hypothetical protein